MIVGKIENGLERGFVKHRLNCLLITDQLVLFFKQNNREARLLGVGFRTENNTSFSRSCHMKDSTAEQIAKDLYNLLLPFNSVKDDKTNTW